MPVDAEVLALSSLHSTGYHCLPRSDPCFEPLRSWIDTEGRQAYLSYLLARPVESLRQPLADLALMVSPDLSIYRDPLIATPGWQIWLTRILHPQAAGPLLFVLGALAAAMVALAARGSFRPAWVVPLALLASAYPLMFVIWHGGTLELERHAAQLALQLRLAGWMMVLFLLDTLARQVKVKL
jgi:hypothetical protein